MNRKKTKKDYEAMLKLNTTVLNEKREELKDLMVGVNIVKEAIRDYEQLEQIYKSMILEDK